MEATTTANQPRFFPKRFSPMFFLFLIYALLFLPFWKPLLLAFLFSCALSPFVNYLHGRFHSGKRATGLLLVTCVVALIFLMLIFGVVRIYGNLYEQFQDPQSFTSQLDRASSVRIQIIQWLKALPFVSDAKIDAQVDAVLGAAGAKAKFIATELGKTFVMKTPEILFNLFIFLASLVVFLVWGSKKWQFLAKLLGRNSQAEPSDFAKFEKICSVSIGTIFVTGLMQATIVSFGSRIAGFSIFLTFLGSFILSLVPVVGAASVPVFLSIFSYANGDNSGAIILAVTALIAGTSDNIVRAWLFSRAANTNPVVTLLAILGGIRLFGFIGLFMAPIVEQLVMSYLERTKTPKEI